MNLGERIQTSMDDSTAERSITTWLGRLKEGDPLAAEAIWNRYITKLVSLARSKLGSADRRASDEEDVAISAFNSFYEAAVAGRLPKLDDRHDLWRVLVTMTAWKAAQQIRQQTARKRGGGIRATTHALRPEDADELLGQLIGDEPSPELAAECAELYGRLSEALPDDQHRQIADWKLQGYTHGEIARNIGRSEKTVERRLTIIRKTWVERCA